MIRHRMGRQDRGVRDERRPERLAKGVTVKMPPFVRRGRRFGRRHGTSFELPLQDIVWTLGSVSALHHRPFDPELLLRELPAPPATSDTLITAARSLGFRIKRYTAARGKLARMTMPCVGLMKEPASSNLDACDSPDAARPAAVLSDAGSRARPALIVQATDEHVMLFRAGTNQGTRLSLKEFDGEFTGTVFQIAPLAEPLKDPDGARQNIRAFCFGWFIPELLKHKRVWRDVLIASLFIQLLALGTPLFTQVVIDKVVVHRTQSTLIVIAVGMGIFAVFSALLS